MLVSRWGILRSAIPQNISLKKTIALVNSLAKLHNFCLAMKDKALETMASDAFRMMNASDGYVTLEEGTDTQDYRVPRGLLDGGLHLNDIPRDIRRRWNRAAANAILPRELLHEKVASSHKVRPHANRR